MDILGYHKQKRVQKVLWGQSWVQPSFYFTELEKLVRNKTKELHPKTHEWNNMKSILFWQNDII